jgi:hypothetical protein
MEEIVRELIAQGAETRNLDYKGPFAWEGDKPDRADLVRDLMCFANTPDGGYILVGVAEGASAWRLVGVSKDQAKTFDPTAIGDLAQEYCSTLPVFKVQRVTVDGRLYVLITVEEFGDQPIVCTKDCHKGNQLGLRAGSIYTRTVDAKCTEIRTPEAMQRLLDLAVRKRGDALLTQIAGLFGGRGGVELPPSDEVQFGEQRASAETYFAEHDLTGPHWQVEIRPARFVEQIVGTRADLAKARDDAEVSLRGWNFPHVDREHSGNFGEGIQSVTRFGVHREAHRVFRSGLFVWRRLISEDLEDERFHNTLIYESTIWSLTEIWLFASRYLSTLLERGNAVVQVAIRGLKGRKLVPDRPSVSLWRGHTCEEDEWRRPHVLPLGELRATHIERAGADAIDLFELFGVEVAARVIRSWQDKLLKREF